MGDVHKSIVATYLFQAGDGIRGGTVTGVQTCALPISCFARSVLSGSRTMRSSSLRTSKYSTFGKSWTMRLGRVIWFLTVFLASMALPCNKEVRKYYSRGARPARTD